MVNRVVVPSGDSSYVRTPRNNRSGMPPLKTMRRGGLTSVTLIAKARSGSTDEGGVTRLRLHVAALGEVALEVLERVLGRERVRAVGGGDLGDVHEADPVVEAEARVAKPGRPLLGECLEDLLDQRLVLVATVGPGPVLHHRRHQLLASNR